ncbi:unnamed protein product [Rotaria sp. Silwood1]|nr:unnamed protein product [Rotaria sp. Silwood1]CAF1581501.1 unnamed protein product [Rotaria sp. Silwood1]CAF3625451.1 unnamed protein product [Rotaria sp. Silwood1]CAF3662263.1 unnamed protein product [Rotaria sp. Silwood1]CAF3713582.1 unnamed protein product [Rotaria sp. Silwood1]
MYPNQQYPQAGGGSGGSYPQQPPYGGAYGTAGGYQQNMPTPYGGNQGGYAGGPNNPYNQGGVGGGPSNPYNQSGFGGPNNPYNQGGYSSYGQSSGYGPGNYQNFNQQPYGASPYAQNPGMSGTRYPPPQSGGYGPSPGNFMPNDPRGQRLNQVIQQYEINQQFAARLYALGNCEVVLLCDDSGSMNTPLQGTNQTRWDELKSLVNIVVDICAVMDSNGVDVYFLNRDPMLNVTDTRYVRQVFNTPPQGLTPLVPALRRIIAAKRNQSFEKKLLILIATDGAPTDAYGNSDVGTLEAVLRHERTPQTYVTFLACTDDLPTVNYLSNWDKMMPNLDVMDDYRSERAEIQRTRGVNFPFSFGDYIVKSLLGSIDPWFDSLDDRA